MISLVDKAFIDTSVLVDALLKQSDQGQLARAALKKIKHTQLPVYAIKELKAGALRYYVWFHNKVVTTSKWGDAVEAIERIGFTPQRNRLNTALHALREFEGSIGKATPSALAARYPSSSMEEIYKDEARLWLKTLIFRAWRNRRKIVSQIVCPLSCYPEGDLSFGSGGVIYDQPVLCNVEDCCQRDEFVGKKAKELEKLFDVMDKLPEKPETAKRRKALRQLVRTPKRFLGESECRALGDAVFALQCPKDAIILTTNIADHRPLAEALGLAAKSPKEV